MTSTQPETASLTEQLIGIVAEEGLVDRASITMESELDQLGIKSADFVMILMAIEEKFGVYIAVDDDLTGAKTVGELIAAVSQRISEHREQTS